MKKVYLKITLFILLVSSIIYSCSTVPLTGRTQLNLYPESEMIGMSLTQYDDFLKQSTLSDNKEQTAMVKRVGNKIAIAVEEFLKQNNLQSRIEGFQWEFNLVVEDETPNAWCMPGGKVVVYSGLLPYTKSEEGLAVVMGHEIAHAVARHGNERMSQQVGIQLGGVALATALSEKPQETQQIFMAAYGVGSEVGLMLPYSRSHETEADKMGLIFMAMAGYNPNAAVEFWQRMSQSGGQKPPEFLSTHPSDNTRIRNLKAYIPEAMKYYKK
ncbi:MAG: M48 family metallopeptidase [Marinilabiliaceae bacterium]|nr:M48 family metallopeptidase [Marinilabiliaceae bacterium]